MASTNAAKSPALDPVVDRQARVEAFIREHHSFAWRCLRRLGLSAADADEAAQRVFLVATSRFNDIQSGCERAFLFRTATHVASKVRRSAARRPETLLATPVDAPDPAPLADELLDQRYARQLLDDALAELPDELAAVIVLFEIEGLTTSEVAVALEVKPGTVASRLKRARTELERRVFFRLKRTQHKETSR